ncbi:zinc knuckle [Cooperia oncophora]
MSSTTSCNEHEMDQIDGTNPLNDWNAIGVSCEYEDINKCFENILVQLSEVLTDQIRNFSSAKRGIILGTVRETVRNALVKVKNHLEGREQSTSSSFFDEVQMSVEELREFLPTVSSHSRTLCQIAARLGCELNQAQVTQMAGPSMSEARSADVATAGEEVNDWNNIRSHYTSLKHGENSVQRRNGLHHKSDGPHCVPTAASQKSSRQCSPVSSRESTSDIVKQGTFNGVVEALKAARKNPCDRLRDIKEWESLSKKNGESVVDFCCRMEDLSRKIHPSSEWDFIRGSKLYSCFQHWQNSYYMMAALDAPEGRVYEEVKRVAMRLEKLQFDSNTQLRFQKRGFDRQGSDPQKTPSFNTTSEQAGTLAKSIPKCNFCGKRGHLAADCRKREKPSNHKYRENGHNRNYSDTRNNAAGGSSLVTELDRWCKTVQRKGEDPKLQSGAVGKPSTCEVEIFGITAKALVDTGSVISIIPVGLLKRVREQGVDLDAKAHIVGDGKQRRLFDASGNAMSFLSEITAEVMVIGASTACVHMHVQQSNDDNVFTTATNYFKNSLRGFL